MAGESSLLNSKALTKIQSIVLACIIAVATISGIATYYLLSHPSTSSETIKIGVCADLDGAGGQSLYQQAVLAVEHVNAEGGVLGMKLEIVAEDDGSETFPADIAVASSAMTKLITVDKADYIIGYVTYIPVYQEIVAEHKKILFDTNSLLDEYSQKVLDDYDRYKYYFRVGNPNFTSAQEGTADSMVVCRELTGFNKVALVSNPFWGAEGLSNFANSLEEVGFEVVYQADIPFDTVDFTSYFANAEEAGAEILGVMGIFHDQACIPFVNEYYTRQSPMIMWGNVFSAQYPYFWEATEGKCEYVTSIAYPTTVGYPFTSKTLAFREAYLERWGGIIPNGAVYDTVRYILVDAIKRAGTTETEAVIKALETTDIETSLVRRFVFTSSHDIMIGEAGPNRPGEDYFLVTMFQWQDGKQVPIYPKEIMEEAGVTYKFPDWAGAWD